MQRLQTQQLYCQMALVSKYLAAIPLQDQHRLNHIRIALKLNFQIGNFKTSLQLLQVKLLILQNLTIKGYGSN